MRRTAIVIGYFCVISALAWGAESSSNFKKYWPTWRGPNATGVAPEADPPMEWSENKKCPMENINSWQGAQFPDRVG